MSINPRQYRAPKGAEIRVDLKDGRMAVVGPEWRTLPLDYHNEAVRSGCEVDTARYSASDEAEPSQGKAASPPGSDDAVRVRLLEMLNRDDPDDFVEATGKPNLRVLSQLCGFTVDQSQASRVLKALEAEAAEIEAEERRVAEQAAADTAAAAQVDPEAAAAAAQKKLQERKDRAAKALKKVAAKTPKTKTAASA